MDFSEGRVGGLKYVPVSAMDALKKELETLIQSGASAANITRCIDSYRQSAPNGSRGTDTSLANKRTHDESSSSVSDESSMPPSIPSSSLPFKKRFKRLS
jgi:hypothetical protein